MAETQNQTDLRLAEKSSGAFSFQRRTSQDTLNGPELSAAPPAENSGPILSSTKRILERHLGVENLWEHHEQTGR